MERLVLPLRWWGRVPPDRRETEEFTQLKDKGGDSNQICRKQG